MDIYIYNAHTMSTPFFPKVPKCRWPTLAASVDVGKLGEMRPQLWLGEEVGNNALKTLQFPSSVKVP